MGNLRIFMSYCHADVEWCKPFAEAMREAGHDVWFDEQLDIGNPWVAGIEQELQSREHFLIVLTPDAWASEWVRRELHLAWTTHRTIIPLQLKETSVSGFLLTLQWVSVEGLDLATATRKVTHTLEQSAARSQAHSAAATASPTTPPASNVAQSQLPPSGVLAQSSTLSPARAQPRLFVWSLVKAAPETIVPLHGSKLTIGRDADNDFTVDDPAMSRHHACVVNEGDRWMLRAQAGSTPMYVNGKQVVITPIYQYDQIVLGTTLLRFEPAMERQRSLLTEMSRRNPLLIVDCPLCHFVAPLRDDVITVGRSVDCGLIIPSPVVARVQARLERVGTSYTLIPHEATNPLLHHGLHMQPRILVDGDILTIDGHISAYAVALKYTISPL